MRRKTLRTGAAHWMAITLLAIGTAAANAKGDLYAYMVAKNFDFGVVDLDAGVFTLCGNSGAQVAGLGIAPSGTIYAGTFQTSTVSTVDPSNGALTTIGSTGLTIFGFGSTKKGLYAFDASGNLYSIDPVTAASTLIGATGLTLSGSTFGVSDGSAKLYVSLNGALYVVNARNAKAALIGSGSSDFGALLYAKGTLYGGSAPAPSSIYSVNTQTGADSFVAQLQGESTDFWGLAPTPKRANGSCPAG
jgi:hypothetical protein